MKKKLTALCLVALMAFGTTACAGNNNSSTPAQTPTEASATNVVSEKLIEPTFWITSASYMYSGEEIAFQAIREATNIQFKPIVVTIADYPATLATTMASGTLPDLMGLRSNGPVKQYGPQGAFVDLKPYMDNGQMPNFKAMLEKYPPAMTLAAATDGGIYGGPRIYDMDFRIDETLLIREDIFTKNNISTTFNTFDDIYTSLKALKKIYPNSTPYVSRWGYEHHLFEIARHFDSYYTFFESPVSDDYQYGPAQPGYKEMLSFFNRLYAEGLLDPEFATMSDAQFEEKFATERAFMTYDYPQVGAEIAAKLADTVTDGYNLVSAVQPAYNGNLIGTKVLQGYWGYTKCISSASPYKEELVKFLEWTYSPEGADTLIFGIEGDTYFRNGNEITMADDINYGGNPNGTRKDHMLGDQNIFSVLTQRGRDIFEVADPYLKQSMDIIAKSKAFGKPAIPVSFANEEERVRYNDLKTPLDTFVTEASVAIITGKRDIATWDTEIMPQLESMGYKEALGLIQKAYNETLGR